MEQIGGARTECSLIRRKAISKARILHFLSRDPQAYQTIHLLGRSLRQAHQPLLLGRPFVAMMLISNCSALAARIASSSESNRFALGIIFDSQAMGIAEGTYANVVPHSN
jgi:hypothetical protein